MLSGQYVLNMLQQLNIMLI